MQCPLMEKRVSIIVVPPMEREWDHLPVEVALAMAVVVAVVTVTIMDQEAVKWIKCTSKAVLPTTTTTTIKTATTITTTENHQHFVNHYHREDLRQKIEALRHKVAVQIQKIVRFSLLRTGHVTTTTTTPTTTTTTTTTIPETWTCQWILLPPIHPIYVSTIKHTQPSLPTIPHRQSRIYPSLNPPWRNIIPNKKTNTTNEAGSGKNRSHYIHSNRVNTRKDFNIRRI